MAGNAAKKQHAENQKRLLTLISVIGGINVYYVLLRVVWQWTTWTLGPQLVFALVDVVVFLVFWQLQRAGSPVYGPEGQLDYGGADLAGAGFFEYMHDVLYVGLFVLLLSPLTDYAWLALLAVPAFAVFKLWNSVIAPWIFAPAPEQPQLSDKQKRKIEKVERTRR